MHNKVPTAITQAMCKFVKSYNYSTLIRPQTYLRKIDKAEVVSAGTPDCHLNLLRSPSRFFSTGSIRSLPAAMAQVKPSEYSSGFFRLSDYDCVGFDLDNTICRYKLTPMIKLEYDTLAEYMVKEKGYDPQYLYKPLHEDAGFMKKGLVLDFAKGNLLQIDCNGYVSSASHGTRFLNDSEIQSTYGKNRQWGIAAEFTKNMLEAWNGPLSEKIRTLLDYFDLPTSLIFARIVDSLDAKEGQPLQEYNIWPDILEALINMYQRENFASNSGGYFPAIKENPEKFINRCSETVINWLKKIKREKTTFLITGSHVDFASLVASTSMGEDWLSLFDIVIFYARKPGFFIGGRPFVQIEDMKETTTLKGSDLHLGTAYSQGNWQDLYQLLQKASRKNNPKCVYIGDNLIQDVYTPSEFTDCDTVAIVEELLVEGMGGSEEGSDLSVLISEKWGSYFCCINNTSEFSYSLWAEIIRKHSQICVPSLEVLAQYSLNHRYFSFVTDDKDRSKQLGYFPAVPASLKL